MIAAVASGLALVCVLSRLGPSLPRNGLVRVTVSHDYFQRDRDPSKPWRRLTVEKSSTDPIVLARILAVANAGRRTTPHKCAGSSELTFQYSDGTSRTLGFLFGHDARFCELAENGVLYRISRQAFFDAITASGIDQAMLRGRDAVEPAVAPVGPAAGAM
jgi:hypothetical protein